MRPFALRTSLTIVYTGVLAALLTAMALGYHSILVRSLDADATTTLEDKARGLHGYLRFRNGQPVLEYDHDDPEVAAFIDDVTDYYQIYDAQTGRLLLQSPALASLGRYTPEEVSRLRANPGISDVRTSRGRLRLSTSAIAPAQGGLYLLQVGEPLQRADRTVAAFERLLRWGIPIGLVAAAFAGRWLAGRALVPLARLAEATRAIGITKLQERLPVRGVDDEVDRVARAFNQALASLEMSVGEMRQFSVALAHELRTPLAVLRGEAELALRQSSSAEGLQHLLASQIDEYDRLTRLINQILTLARAEAGEIKMGDEPVDLAALAASVAEQVDPVAAERGLTLTCDAPGPVPITGDAGWLQRLLLILLDNAIKFTPADGRISIATSSDDERARIVVTDTGIGMTPDVLPHVFERFYRADSARSRENPGAGLGLALAKWIVDQHHGTIEVSSESGRGSRFSVSFPALAATAPPGADRGSFVSQSGSTG